MSIELFRRVKDLEGVVAALKTRVDALEAARPTLRLPQKPAKKDA